MKKLTNEQFIERAKKIHNDKYDYSKVKYVNNRINVTIICPIHGEFQQTPESHLSGHGCPQCGKLQKEKSRQSRYTTESFVLKAKEIHGDKYNYDKTEYINSFTKVCITCKEHGDFWVTPNDHLNKGSGCPKCWSERRGDAIRFSKSEFIDKLKEIYGNKYDYSKIEYKNISTPVLLICPEHGEFWQTPKMLLWGYGCKQCSNELRKLTTEEFIRRAKQIHGNYYDYSKVSYVDYKTDVEIICPKHGSFFQSPNTHIGIKSHGCPKCKRSKGEEAISLWLNSYKITYEIQYKVVLNDFELYIDFYLPEQNIFIEYNGDQHYSKNKLFHPTDEEFFKQLKRDAKLRKYCSDNKITLIEIPTIVKDLDNYLKFNLLD